MATYSEYHTEPRPERWVQMSFLTPEKPSPMLSIGIKTILADNNGLKIYPQKVIVIALGITKENPEEKQFDISAKDARFLSKKFLEYADVCDENTELKHEVDHASAS